MVVRSPALARERSALDVHRVALRGSALPTPKRAPRGTFLHGFLLPFTLIATTLRDGELRSAYLRVVFGRALVVTVLGALAFRGAEPSLEQPRPRIVHRRDNTTSGRSIHFHVPGVDIDLDDHGTDNVEVLGKNIPVVDPDEKPVPQPPAAGVVGALQSGWHWAAALVALLSMLEALVVFVSRRFDDSLSFRASRLAGILPEEETPKPPGLALDLKWLFRKLKRRVRGYVVLGAGVPLLATLHFVPTVGPWLFRAAATAWGWYWLGVFSAAKSAHAWADADTAPAPAIIRTFASGVPRWCTPLRAYAAAWARLTRGVNAAAATFERSPAPFLGLALARAILALPGLYLLARPLVPVAAGRLCAEADPADRFSSREPH